MNDETNSVTSKPWNTTQQQKGLNYRPTKQPGWISRELGWVEKANPKVYICITFLEWENYRNGEQISGCQGLRRKWGWEGCGCGYENETWGILAGMEMLYILTASMSISWWWYCALVLQDVTVGWNWAKVAWIVSVLSLQLHMNL